MSRAVSPDSAKDQPGTDSSEAAHEDGQLQPDADFWFADGNVVFVAQRTAFRVHQGVLARHSGVFQDMFSVAHPDDTRLFDCPAVYMHDPAADLRFLLHVLYDGRSFYMRSEHRPDFEEVAALIRLAHKYQIDDLKEAGLACLKIVCPDDLAAWDKLVKRWTSSSAIIPIYIQQFVSLVNLARLTDTLSLLPIAFFMCSLISTKTLLKGVPRSDGTMESLSLEDLQRCIDGKCILAQRTVYQLTETFSQTSADCSNSTDTCSTISRHTFDRLIPKHGIDPIIILVPSLDLYMHPSLCEQCRLFQKSKHAEIRESIWRDLPSYFGLGSWEELHAP